MSLSANITTSFAISGATIPCCLRLLLAGKALLVFRFNLGITSTMAQMIPFAVFIPDNLASVATRWRNAFRAAVLALPQLIADKPLFNPGNKWIWVPHLLRDALMQTELALINRILLMPIHK